MEQRRETDVTDVEQPKRKGFTTGVVTEFTVMPRIKPGQGQTVRDVIKKVAEQPDRARAIREIGTLHEARFVVFDDDSHVLFCSSFDGTWDKYIDDFATTYIAHLFDAVFSHCEGYPGLNDPNIKDWFQLHAIEASNFISAYPNATVKQIWRALEVEKAFQEVLDNPEAEKPLQDPALKPLLNLAST